MTQPDPRTRFEAGFHQGYDDAARDSLRDSHHLMEHDKHHACGYSRGVVRYAMGCDRSSAAAWVSYVDWLHETQITAAAELIDVEEAA